jgi:hypothetical protein
MPQYTDYNPLTSYPKSEPTITLSKQQLHTIPEPPPVQVFRSQPLTQNPILPSHSTQPTTRTMANPLQVGVNALPIQGKRDAPRTFKGSYDKVEDFLKTMDKLYARYQVTTQKDKVEAILPYCSTKVQDFIKTSSAYRTPDWAKLKAHMMVYYDADRATRKYVPKDIIEFTLIWNQKPITNLTTWKKYYRDYHAIAGSMFDRGEMSQKDFDTYFWLGLPKDLRAIFEPKLQAQILDYDASQPYELEKIETVAENYFKRNKFTEMVFNPLHYHIDEESDSESDDDSDDSDSDSDYERRRKRRHKKKKKTRTKYSRAKPTKEPAEKPTHRYQGSEQDISGMIKQLNKMSINDPAYASMYFDVITQDTTGHAKDCIRKPIFDEQPTGRSSRSFPTSRNSNNRPAYQVHNSSPPFSNNFPTRNNRPAYQVQNSPATFPNNFPLRNRNMMDQEQRPECWGCGGEGHRAIECPRMQEFLRQGVVIYDTDARKYLMHDRRPIVRRWNEMIADAVQRTLTLSYRPAPEPTSNFVTLGADVHNYYQQDQDDDEDSDGYESDSDDGPYWRVALNTQRRHKAYVGEEYEEEYEKEEEDEEDYYEDPAYEVYPAERSSTRIAEARERASRMPGKAPPREKFEGVFPPPRKEQPTQPPPQPIPAQRPAPPMQPPAPPAVTRRPPAPPPAPPRVQAPVQPPAQTAPRPPPQVAPRQPPAIPRNQRPIDARQPRIVSEDVEMRDVSRQAPPPVPRDIPQTLPRDPPAHVSNKENLEKARGPIRQSELSTQINTKEVVSEILQTEIPLTLGKLLGASKEIAFDLQERLRPRNKTVAALERRPFVTEATKHKKPRPGDKNSELINLEVMYNGYPITAIIDTGSQLNVMKEEIAHMIRVPIDLTQPITMNDANGGKGVLKGCVESINLNCGPLDTFCEIWIGESVPFDLLLGRPWQTKNHVSIVERQTGTHLEFRNEESDAIQYEVCVSPAVREPPVEQRRGPFRRHPGPQTYALTTPRTPHWTHTSDFYFDLDYHQEEVISKLRETLGTTIVAARRMSQQLDPPPPMETYSVLGNLGTRMFFQLLEKHRNNWDVSGYQIPKRLQPIETTIDADIVEFLTRKESATWNPGLSDTLDSVILRDIYAGQMYDLMRFLEIAIQRVRKESPEFQPIPPLEVPDPDYELARMFHHYFAQYRTKFSPQLLLTSASDKEVINFILQEYVKAPVSTPLTHEQEEEQSFQAKLVTFLLSAEGKMFLSDKYARLYNDAQELKPEEQAFILLYWRYKRYWKQTLALEQAPIAEITRFLSKYYMEYWQQQIGADDKMEIIGENEVYSIFLMDKSATNELETDSTDSKNDSDILEEFYRFITPQRRHVNNSQPPALNKPNRIKHGIITSAGLDPLWPLNDDYTPPPTPSPSPKITWKRNNDFGDLWPEELISKDPYDQVSHEIESDVTLENDGSDKENIPPFLGDKGHHCRTKRVNNGKITQNGRNDIASTGDAYTGTAGSLTKAVWEGDQRPTTRETTRKMRLSTKERGQKNRNNSEYKRPEKRLQEHTQHSLFSMQSPSAAEQRASHPHADINTSHNLRNSVIHAELSSASLSITSPDARITEFNYNSTIPDSYYAKVYLPNATLTGYKDGSLRTTEGHAFACVHFDPRDPRIFDLAGLNAPDPEGHVPRVNNAEATRPSATATSTTNPFTSSDHTARSTIADPQPTTTGSPRGSGSTTATSQHATTTSPVSRSFALLDAPATSYHITVAQPASRPDGDEAPTVPAFLLREGKAMLENPITFGSTPTNDHIAADEENTDAYTKVEWLFLNQVLGYCQGKEELRKGISIPEELCQGEFLEGLGMEGRVSLRLPMLESLFVRASRTWPDSLFKMFARKCPRPSVYDNRGYLQLPTPETSSEDDMPSLEHSSAASSDIDWTYPPTPPPLPSLEAPRVAVRPPPDVPEEPELTPLELPLRQFEDLQVDSDNGPGERDEAGEDNSNVPGDVEMENIDDPTHPTPADVPPVTVLEDDSIYGEDDVPPPKLSGGHDLSPTEEEDELTQDEPDEEGIRRESQPALPLEIDRRIIEEEPPRSYYQQYSRAAMSRSMSRILAQMLPLISTRFGSRVSFRAINRLREVVPPQQFEHFFREYGSYAELAKSISAVREGQRNVPNRWQAHLPRIRRIRQLITQYIDDADSLVKHHGYLDGLKEYVVQHEIKFWNVEAQGLLYYHEAQYLYALREFLANESYSDLASRTQRLLQSRFEYPNDLWALVYTILGRIDPPSYELEIDCNFEPRTDDDAQAKRAQFEKTGRF